MTDTFPTIKSWSDALKSLGVTTALYMQPTFRNSDYASQYPGHMIGNNAKETADYTDPDFLAHMAEVYRNIKNADIKLMMYDYTNMNKAAGGDTIKRTGGFADPYATAVSAYRNMFAIAKQGVGKDFRVMENAWTWAGEDVAIGVIDFQRTGTDTGSPDAEYRAQRPVSVVPQPHHQNPLSRCADFRGRGFGFAPGADHRARASCSAICLWARACFRYRTASSMISPG